MSVMDIKNMAGLVVGVVVGVVLLSALLFPIVGEATATTTTFKNDGYYHLTKYEATDSVTLEWDAATPDVFTVNGEEVTYHNDSGLAVSIGLGQRFAVRLPVNNTAINFYGAGTYINTNATYTTFTLTYTGGTVTATNGDATKEIASVSEIFVISADGDYVMKKSDAHAYLNSGSEVVADSEIYASGQTYNGANYIFWHLEGTINDMDYPDTFDNNLTITNEAIHGEYSTKYNDLYVLDNLTFTATASNAVVYNVTASYFVVPAEVTAEKTVHMNDVENTLVGIIPVLIVMGLILGVLAFFYSRRE